MSIRVFCDVCKKELTRNMVDQRLVVDAGDFHAEVMLSKQGTANDGDLCLDCLMKMLTTPSRKPRADKGTHRKPQVETVTVTTAALQQLTEAINRGHVGKLIPPDEILVDPGLREMEEGLNSEGLTLLKPARKKVKTQVEAEPIFDTTNIPMVEE